MHFRRRITCQDVIDQLFNLFVLRGIPEHIRSDNGTEFTAREKIETWRRDYDEWRLRSDLDNLTQKQYLLRNRDT